MGTKNINLGCGFEPLPGFINVDSNPNANADVFEDILKYITRTTSFSIDHLIADNVIEHLSITEEHLFFRNAVRALKEHGKLELMVPDLEWACKKFAEATENNFEWYQSGAKDHYFGGGMDVSKRWSYLLATIYGHQNGPGQVHKNGYTKGKFKSIGKEFGLKIDTLENYMRKTAQCIRVVYIKS